MADDVFGKPKERAQGLSLKHLIKIHSCLLFHFIIILPMRAPASSSSSVKSVKNTGFFFLFVAVSSHDFILFFFVFSI